MRTQDETRVRQAMDEILAGEFRQAYTTLARLLRMPEHELRDKVLGVPEPPRSIAAVTPPSGSAVLQPTAPQVEEQLPGRIVDEAALAAFRLAHPICCMRGCGRKAVAHHIIERGEIRIDRDWNLLNLCDFGLLDGHHQGPKSIHELGPNGFIAEHVNLLEPAIVKKITAARAWWEGHRKQLHAAAEPSATRKEGMTG